MALETAPLFEDLAGGPAGGRAWWLTTDDGTRIRVAHWGPATPAKGTVLLFPGRTEYIEKYGRTAADLATRGYGTLTIDWRGQGLADRLLKDRRIGHVAQFTDYQKDIAAMLGLARGLDLPRPWHLLAHSMGGAIGLRWLMDGADVASAAFSAPMWGIFIAPLMRPAAEVWARVGPSIGFAASLPAGTTIENYVQVQAFEGNTLTGDTQMYAMMQDQLAAQPELGLGGPSLHWLREALAECRGLKKRPSPDMPCLTFLGTREQIVDPHPIHARMDRWSRGELVMVQGAEHEVLMETPAIRGDATDRMVAFFTAHS